MTEGTHPAFELLHPGARVAIVSGSFRSGYSYQENIWAEQLADLGYQVLVFCAEPGHSGEPSPLGYSVQSIPYRGLANRNVYLERGVGNAVRDFRPALILWFGPPQLFGRSLLDAPRGKTPLVLFMGQNRRMQAFDWKAPGLTLAQRAKALVYRGVRGPTIAKACRSASLVVANTEETPGILDLYLGRHRASVRSKTRCFPLGFDPHAFGYNPQRRADSRSSLSLDQGTILLVISSRFSPEKHAAITHLLDGAMEVLEADPRVELALVGDGEDAFSQMIRNRLASHPLHERLHAFGFRDRSGLSDAFHAADIAMFAQPSISCQEALGTGLYSVFADDGSMDWLLTCPEDGAFYETGQHNALVTALENAVDLLANETEESRRVRAKRASRLSYTQIIAQVVEALHQVSGEQHAEE